MDTPLVCLCKTQIHDQVRGDLPPEAEVPTINVENADSRFASAYLSFTSNVLKQNEITDYLVRIVQPRLSAVPGVQRADILHVFHRLKRLTQVVRTEFVLVGVRDVFPV